MSLNYSSEELFREARMLRTLFHSEPNEVTAQVICSTAQRSKGREWNYVHLDPYFEAVFVRAARLGSAQSVMATAAERAWCLSRSFERASVFTYPEQLEAIRNPQHNAPNPRVVSKPGLCSTAGEG